MAPVHARARIASARQSANAIEFMPPKQGNDLLGDRSANEAYCFAQGGQQYAVHSPDGGAVTPDVSAAEGSLQFRWLDISRSVWQ